MILYFSKIAPYRQIKHYMNHYKYFTDVSNLLIANVMKKKMWNFEKNEMNTYMST